MLAAAKAEYSTYFKCVGLTLCAVFLAVFVLGARQAAQPYLRRCVRAAACVSPEGASLLGGGALELSPPAGEYGALASGAGSDAADSDPSVVTLRRKVRSFPCAL